MTRQLRAFLLAVFGIAIGACSAAEREASPERASMSAPPPECVETKTLPLHDRWQGFGLLTVRSATRETPEVVEFETEGIADVALDRLATRYMGRVRLDIEEVPAAPGLPTDGCSTGWFELSRILQVRVPTRRAVIIGG